MDLPESASGANPNKPVQDLSKKAQEIILNPFYGKEFVTPFEALTIINMLSQALMMNETRKDGH